MSKLVTLGELVAALEPIWGHRIELGLAHPHSYRGSYNYVAFYPAEDVPVEEMLLEARGAIGSTFTAYKGGDYTMTAETPVYVAEWGSTGWPLTRRLLKAMLKGVE